MATGCNKVNSGNGKVFRVRVLNHWNKLVLPFILRDIQNLTEHLSGKTALAFELNVGSHDPQESPPTCVLHGSATGTTQLITQLTCTGDTVTQPTHTPADNHLINQLTSEPWCSNFLSDAQLFPPTLTPYQILVKPSSSALLCTYKDLGFMLLRISWDSPRESPGRALSRWYPFSLEEVMVST